MKLLTTIALGGLLRASQNQTQAPSTFTFTAGNIMAGQAFNCSLNSDLQFTVQSDVTAYGQIGFAITNAYASAQSGSTGGQFGNNGGLTYSGLVLTDSRLGVISTGNAYFMDVGSTAGYGSGYTDDVLGGTSKSSTARISWGNPMNRANC